MATENIVLCLPVQDRHLRQIQDTVGDRAIIVSTQQQIAVHIFDADIFYGHAKVPIDWPAVVRQGRLRWIQSSAAGLDHCLAPAVIRSEIVVSGCSGLFADQVAEQTMALLYGLIRSLPAFMAAQRKHVYQRHPTGILHGKTIGIVGFGGNGRRIAQLLETVAGRLIATDCFPEMKSPDYVELLAAENIDLLFRQSDVVIVTLPLSQQTEHLIGAELFGQMRHGSYFINVGRGSVVDHQSLCDAIKSGQIAGAGLDVVDPEPLPREHCLWDLENVIITPHVGAQSPFRVDQSTDLFCRNFERYQKGEALINLVDKQLGFPRPQHRFK
jgi:D-3-phosphoglycerate dehydrogenase